MAKIDILNRSNQKIVEINLGTGKIVNGKHRIIHKIDILELGNICSRIESMADQLLTTQPAIYRLIIQRTEKIKYNLQMIRPRRKRAISWIGSAWKWIAGNPDEYDLNIIMDHLNGLLENSNTQTIINRNFEERLNKLSDLYDSWKNKASDTSVVIVLEELRNLQEAVEDILTTIHLAKANVINQRFWDQKEVENAVDIVRNNSLPFESEAQALDYAEVVIAYSENTLLTILKFPTVEPENFEYNIIRPVIGQDGNIIATNIKEVLQNGDTVYSVGKRCSVINSIFLCDPEDIINLKNESCIRSTLTQKNATCTMSNSHHIQKIEKLAENIILINNGRFEIKTSCGDDTMLQGTFVLKIQNCSVDIDGRRFKFLDRTEASVKDAIWQFQPVEAAFNEKTSLEYLHSLHINNTKWLKKVETTQTTHFFATNSVSLLLVMCIAGAIIGLYFWICKRTAAAIPNIPISLATITTNEQLTGNVRK
jgi:Gypsy protein